MKRSLNTIRTQIRNRLVHKAGQKEIHNLAKSMSLSLADTERLRDWQKDFAFRSLMEFHTNIYWGTVYNVHPNQIRLLQLRPNFKALQDKLKYDLRSYTLRMRMTLVRESMEQYLRIFNMRETQFNVETKRKSAKELIEMFGFGVVNQGDADSSTSTTLNVPGLDIVNNPDAENLEVSVDSLKAEVAKLESLNSINSKVLKYSKEPVDVSPTEEPDADTDVRRITRGFNKSGPNPITVD